MTAEAMTVGAMTAVAMIAEAMTIATSRRHVHEWCDVLHISEGTLGK